jgi:hypothetical protein
MPRGRPRGSRNKPAPPAKSPVERAEEAMQAHIDAICGLPEQKEREAHILNVERGLLRVAVEVRCRNNERMTAS